LVWESKIEFTLPVAQHVKTLHGKQKHSEPESGRIFEEELDVSRPDQAFKPRIE
jgi:hypothetical protein